MEILSYILHESEGFCRSVMSDSLQPHGLYQAPLSMRFPRQEYWSGLPFPSPVTYYTYCKTVHGKIAWHLANTELADDSFSEEERTVGEVFGGGEMLRS